MLGRSSWQFGETFVFSAATSPCRIQARKRSPSARDGSGGGELVDLSLRRTQDTGLCVVRFVLLNLSFTHSGGIAANTNLHMWIDFIGVDASGHRSGTAYWHSSSSGV